MVGVVLFSQGDRKTKRRRGVSCTFLSYIGERSHGKKWAEGNPEGNFTLKYIPTAFTRGPIQVKASAYTRKKQSLGGARWMKKRWESTPLL